MNQTLLRSILKIGAGYLAAKGLADEATGEIIVAGVVALISVVWGIVERRPPTPPTATAPATNLPGPGEHVQPTRPGVVMALLYLVCIATPLLFQGCTNPRAVAYQTLSDIRAVVDRAEQHYGAEVRAGRVTLEQQEQIDARIVKFHAAFLTAVRAARADYTTPASADLDRLADALVSLIYTFAKEPAP